jgi:glutaredoxin
MQSPLTVIYTRAGCAKCVSVKNRLKEKDHSFREMVIEKDITREEVMDLFPGVKSLPILTVEGKITTIEDL